MTNTIYFQVLQQELNETGSITTAYPEYIITDEYTDASRGALTLPSVNRFVSISFGNIVTSSCVHLNSDYDLSIQLNGSNDSIDGVKNFIFSGQLNSLSIKNTSGNTATVNYEIYGE